jgi:hypothetical protein
MLDCANMAATDGVSRNCAQDLVNASCS